MPRLRPRIGKKDEDATDARIGKSRDDIARVALVNPDIGLWFAIETREKFGDAGLIGLGADHSDIGMMLRLPEQMLTRTETNFEPDIFNRGIEGVKRIAQL